MERPARKRPEAGSRTTTISASDSTIPTTGTTISSATTTIPATSTTIPTTGSKKADWEIAIEKMAAQYSQFQEETRSNLRNTGASIKNMEIQMSQIAQQMTNTQPQGALPSATVTNPRDNNHVNVVTTRRNKSKETHEKNSDEEDMLIEVDVEIKENEVVRKEVIGEEGVVKEKVATPKPAVRLPFPTRNKKKEQHEKNFEKFLEMFKKLELNIPFLEALEQMPTYAKFLKDIISKKRTING